MFRHYSRQPHVVTKQFPNFIKLFTLLTYFMYFIMLPNQFQLEKTIIRMNNQATEDNTHNVDAHFVWLKRIFDYFSYEIKMSGKFISTAETIYHLWIAAIPSLFFSISIVEFASSTTTKLITYLHWRFIIIGTWWMLQLTFYFHKSIRNMCKLFIAFYVNNEKWNWKIILMGLFIIILKVHAFRIGWKIIDFANEFQRRKKFTAFKE